MATTAKKPTAKKTTTKSSTAAKTTTAKKRTTRTPATAKVQDAAAEPVKLAAVAFEEESETMVEDVPIPEGEETEFKKVELVDKAVERSGIKKKFAKPAIEAALAILGEAMAEGRELNLQPMGKLKVTRMKKVPTATVMHARIRQPDRTVGLGGNDDADASVEGEQLQPSDAAE